MSISRLRVDVKVCPKCRDKNRMFRKHIEYVFATKRDAKSQKGTHVSCGISILILKIVFYE